MEKTLDVSVVVRTYTDKRWDYLVEALESVQRQRTPARELVVVVDHNPELYQRVQQRFPDALVVENDQPRGSSGAWNAGIMAAGSSIVAFLDDDAEARPDWLEQLLAALRRPARVGRRRGHPRLLAGGGERPRWFPEEFDWVVGCSYRGLPEMWLRCGNMIAATCLPPQRVRGDRRLSQGHGPRGRAPPSAMTRPSWASAWASAGPTA
jgi:glycosyltransferase involved in cell wall biosynthesis